MTSPLTTFWFFVIEDKQIPRCTTSFPGPVPLAKGKSPGNNVARCSGSVKWEITEERRQNLVRISVTHSIPPRRCATAQSVTKSHLVPRVSHLFAPGGGKMRDPGNEVGQNPLSVTIVLTSSSSRIITIYSICFVCLFDFFFVFCFCFCFSSFLF